MAAGSIPSHMTEPDEDRDEYLRARLDPAEEVLAVGPQGLVTPRRVLFAWRLKWPPRVGGWTHDELTFDEITRWSEGRQHDERPILRLEHPAHRRLQWAPAHRFLWFRWGNRTGIVEYRTTDFRFGSARSPVYLALGRCLAASGATAGEPFHESVSGSREERLGRSVGILYIPRGRIGRLRGRLASLDHDLHHGNIHWWIRVAELVAVRGPRLVHQSVVGDPGNRSRGDRLDRRASVVSRAGRVPTACPVHPNRSSDRPAWRLKVLSPAPGCDPYRRVRRLADRAAGVDGSSTQRPGRRSRASDPGAETSGAAGAGCPERRTGSRGVRP